MANTATLAIRIVSDATKAAKEIDAVSAKTSRMGKVSSAAGKALAVGLGAAAVGAFKLAQGAAEDEQAAANLANTLKHTTHATDAQVKATEDWITAQGKSKGFTDSELRPALAKLAAATHDVGEAQKLAALAMNISVGSGKSLETVSAALAKAQNGSVAGLTKLGIATKETSKDTLALKTARVAVTTAETAYQKALKESGKGSTAARVAAAKLAIAHQKLKDAQSKTKTETIDADTAFKRLAKTYGGAAAKAADTAAGKQARLRVRMDELGESIGARLIPVLLALATAGLAVVGWLEKNQTLALVLVGALGGLLAVVASINLVTKAYTATTAAWATVTTTATAVQTAFKEASIATRIQLAALRVQQVAMTAATKAWTVVTKAAAIAQRVFNAAMRANPIGLIITAIALLVAGIILAYKKSETFRAAVDALGKAGKVAVGWIVDRFKDLWSIIKTVSSWVKDKLVSSFQTMKDRAASIIDAIVAPFQRLKDLVQNILDLISKVKVPSVGGVLDAINPFGRAVPGGVVPAGGDTFVVNINGGFVDDATLDRLQRAFDRRARRRAS